MSRFDYKSTTANLRVQPLTKDEHRSRSLEGMADKILKQGIKLGKNQFKKKKTKIA